MFAGLKCRRLAITQKHLINYGRILNKNKSNLGLWHQDINTDIKLKIEDHWSENVATTPEFYQDKSPCYVLPMFPYPSGNLHMGHVRVYSISDTIARFHNLDGKNVIHPIGWDAFGLPAENAALERNIPPHSWTQANINSMKEQIAKLRFNFDWSRELSTCDANYYKWTQYIFLKLFENGLAYQCKAKVNWDPIDKTVLADEQVDEFGCSWRSGAKVESKILTQWFLKTTKYAKKLYDGLSSEMLQDWKDIINLQRHWIGECNGVVVTFGLKTSKHLKSFDIWTSDPYKFIHGEFVIISTYNIDLQEIGDVNTKEIRCFNPITNVEMPVFVTDDFNYPPGRDVYIASPSFDKDDYKLAKVLNTRPTKSNNVIDKEEEGQYAIKIAHKKNVGGHFVSSTLKDWLISRQRYWGTPIPIIHCEKCGHVPVPYDDLPVKLPLVESLESGTQTLAKIDEWVNCKCPKCQSDAKRETDTMDTFVDSSWYYYRFLDPTNNQAPFAKNKLNGKTPVNLYVGGKEHAVLHLYYARFISYFLHSLGWTPCEEPFKKLVVQGMVMGQSYKLKSTGKYIHPESVVKDGNKYKEKDTGEPVLVQWEKMSKSKFNGENPEKLISTYGCDTTRLLMLADVPPATSRRWSNATLPGVLNWQHRLWLTIRDFLKHRNSTEQYKLLSEDEFKSHELKLWDSRNYFTATATYHFKYTHKLSVGISRLQSLTNALRNNVPPHVIAKSKEYELALATLLIMLTPVTPHFSAELWSGFISAPNRVCLDSPIVNWEKIVLDQRWPKVDDNFKLSFLCKVDGADRCDLKVKATELDKMNSETALKMILSEELIQKRIRTGIFKTKFELYPGCRAILHIFTNKKTNVGKQDKKIEVIV